MKNYLRWTTALVIISLLLSGFGSGCDFGATPDTLTTLNKAIDEIRQQPDRWEGVLSRLIDELGSKEKELVNDLKDLLRGAQTAALDIIHTTGVEFRCNADFTGQRVVERLEYIRDTVLLNKKLSPPLPWICGWAPTSIQLDWQNGRWVSKDNIIKIYGFNFAYDASQKVKIQLRDVQGKSYALSKVTPVYQSPYEVHLNVQAEPFSGAGQGAKMTVLWPGDSHPYEIGVEIKTGPPGPTPIPTPRPLPTTYQIVVRTGCDAPGDHEGTDATVHIILFGTQGQSEDTVLDEPGYDDHNRCKTDTHKVFANADLGDLRMIRIWHDNTNDEPGWFLDGVTITNLRTGQKWEFPCRKWLASDEGDHQTSRDIYPGGPCE